MSTKDIDNELDQEYQLLQAKSKPNKQDKSDKQDKPKAQKTPNKFEQIRREIKETSPIIMENTIRNEETLRKLWLVSLICLIFMTIEIIGGYLANSIAIMSDAAHLLSDFLGFIISIVSIYISRRGATHQMSFGYHRAEVIGALVSVNLIWGLTFWLLYEATLRILHRSSVDGLIMLIVAVIGFLFNVVMGLVLAYEGIDHNLHHHHHEGEAEHEDDHGHKMELTHAPLKRSRSSVGRRSEVGASSKSVQKIKHAETMIGRNVPEKETTNVSNVNTSPLGNATATANVTNIATVKDEHTLEHKHAHNFEPHTHKKHVHHEQKHDHQHNHEHNHSDGHVHAPQEYKENKEKIQHQISEENLRHVSFNESEQDHGEEGHNHDHDHDHDHDEEGHTHDHKNINIRAALIHVIGDAVQNLGVVIAGLIIYFYPEASIADPICTFVFSIIVMFTTIRILKDCIAVLMEGSPVEFDMEKLEVDLYNIRGVVEVHDLHVWSLSIGKLSLSCHLTSTNPQISLRKARKLIKQKYKITHSTIQVELDSEKENEDCKHDLHHEIVKNGKKDN